MISDSVASTISQFFFLSYLDAQAAKKATQKTMLRLRHALHRPHHKEAELKISLVLARRYWIQHLSQVRAGQPLVFSLADWNLPKKLSMASWQDFRQGSEAEEFYSVLLVKVLKVDAELVCQVCEISMGTLRHRLLRGLRVLGQCLQAGATHE